MNEIMETRLAGQGWRSLPPIVALFILLINSYYNGATAGILTYEEYTYTSLLAGVALILFIYRSRNLDLPAAIGPKEFLWGSILLCLGIGCYLVGHSQQIELVDLFSGIPLIAGFINIFGGKKALKILRFPLFLLFFTIPYPSWMIYLLTSPLKKVISAAVEILLHIAGYPVARSGVVLAVGPYRMLVDDACSGMHSLIFLTALGLLFIHLTGPRARRHRAILLITLIPIAVFANFIRVLMLVLITYHFGDALAQGAWHSIAGLLLFASAFFCLFILDDLLLRLGRSGRQGLPQPLASPRHEKGPRNNGHLISWTTSVALTLALLGTGIGAEFLRPHRLLAHARETFSLEQLIPEQLGEWRYDRQADAMLISPGGGPYYYNQVLTRTYVNIYGDRIMLSISYGQNQFGYKFQAHRPESCYRAAGFVLIDSSTVRLVLDRQTLRVRQLIARQNARYEAITYWMTIGDTATLPGIPRKFEQVRFGLRGIIPDGMLIRISSIDHDQERVFKLHHEFIRELQRAVPGHLGFSPGNERSSNENKRLNQI